VSAPTCEKCGSEDLRRAHAHSRARRLYRKLTGQTRYQCHACHHRGWTDRALQARLAGGPTTAPASGRRKERRDLVAHRAARLRIALAVLAAVALGSLVALWLARPGDW
jgi:hypothetical protein